MERFEINCAQVLQSKAKVECGWERAVCTGVRVRELGAMFGVSISITGISLHAYMA